MEARACEFLDFSYCSFSTPTENKLACRRAGPAGTSPAPHWVNSLGGRLRSGTWHAPARFLGFSLSFLGSARFFFVHVSCHVRPWAFPRLAPGGTGSFLPSRLLHGGCCPGGRQGSRRPLRMLPPRRLSPPAPPRGLKAARSPRNRASSCENTGSSSAHQLAASSPWPAARFSQRRPTWLRLRDRTPPRSLQGVLCVLPVPLKQPSRRFLPDAGCFQVFSVSFSRVHAWSGSALWVWTNAPPPQAPSSRRPQNVLGGPRSASLAHSSALAPRTCRPSPRLRLGQDVPRQRC